MSKQIKFLQISSRLRERIDLEKISHKNLDRLLVSDSEALDELIRNVQDLISGELIVHRDRGQVSIGGQCFGPGSPLV